MAKTEATKMNPPSESPDTSNKTPLEPDSSTPDNEEELEKNKLLYDSCKDMYDEEKNRFLRLDVKAFKFLSVLTLLLGMYGFFANWLISNLLRPVSWIEIALVIFGMLIFVCLLVSWFLLFVGVLKAYQILERTPTVEFMTFFSGNQLRDIYESLAWQYKTDYYETFDRTQIKSRRLGWSHKTIVLAVIFLVIFIILFTVYKFKLPEPHVMSYFV